MSLNVQSHPFKVISCCRTKTLNFIRNHQSAINEKIDHQVATWLEVMLDSVGAKCNNSFQVCDLIRHFC